MNRRKLAICDQDKEYLAMLQAYLSKKNPAGFEVVIFSSIEEALLSSKEEGFAILLVSEGIYDTDVINITAQKIFILQEDGHADTAPYSSIPKFQSMEKLIGQVLDAFALDEECVSIEHKCQTAAKLVVFYAPDRHKAQSATALAAAQILSDMGNKVLYLSMQPFSGFEELLGITYESDITDFMYFVLKHSDKLPYKLEGIKKTIHGVDYLPPALDFGDLHSITEEEWKRCAASLIHSGGYSHVVMDLTETCKGFYFFLETCELLYVLSARDAFSKAMYRQFERLMKSKELGVMCRKSICFDVPAGWESAASNLAQLSAAGLGAHMKGIMEQNGL